MCLCVCVFVEFDQWKEKKIRKYFIKFRIENECCFGKKHFEADIGSGLTMHIRNGKCLSGYA